MENSQELSEWIKNYYEKKHELYKKINEALKSKKIKNWQKKTHEKIKKLLQKKATNINTFLTTINKYKNKKITKKNKLKKRGIYILHNKTKNKYYIGQAHNLIKRIKEHFHGKSGTQKEEIYHDYKKNNYFTIKIIITNQLNEIEKQTIWYFRANKKLYNTKKYSLNFWKDIIKIHNKKYYDKINNDPILKNIWRNI